MLGMALVEGSGESTAGPLERAGRGGSAGEGKLIATKDESKEVVLRGSAEEWPAYR